MAVFFKKRVELLDQAKGVLAAVKNLVDSLEGLPAEPPKPQPKFRVGQVVGRDTTAVDTLFSKQVFRITDIVWLGDGSFHYKALGPGYEQPQVYGEGCFRALRADEI